MAVLGHHAGDLVAKALKMIRLRGGGVQIRAADGAGAHVDEHLARAGLWHGLFADFKLERSLYICNLHQSNLLFILCAAVNPPG